MNFRRQSTIWGVVIIVLPLLACVRGLTSAEHGNMAVTPTAVTQFPTGACPIFPPDHIWNVPINNLPVHPMSDTYINAIGADTNFHPDFGSGVWPPGSNSPIGIPFILVPGSQPFVPIHYTLYGNQSDPGPFPIPPNAPIEGGPDSDDDRHVLVIDEGDCVLYELFYAFPVNGGQSWDAGSGARYDLNGYALRPDEWTSADAAGLPIFPGLVRYEEVQAGQIRHALRFTAENTQNAHVWPARHHAGQDDTDLPPMGQYFRLKASFNISGYPADMQVILQAMKTYGIILADNGSNWYVSGVPNENWDNDLLNETFDTLYGSDFEAVDVSSLMIDPDSGQTIYGIDFDEFVYLPTIQSQP